MNFRFKSCYGQNSTQEEVFEKDVRPLLSNVFRGLVRYIHQTHLSARLMVVEDGHRFRVRSNI